MDEVNVAIQVSDLTKIYKLYSRPIDRVKELIPGWKRKMHEDFHALSDVSFQIPKGRTVGILGKNGAGKSTLLKVLTGVLMPSRGKVAVHGKVASLLELGAGFNPEYTGLENIYFQGLLMGYSRQQMDVRLEAILDFADIGDFIHQPVKVYSSGMFARLAFSVSINVEPDILIVDEALSVGDAGFQLKCILKMKALQESGITILFVSHDTQSVIRFCQSIMIMDAGRLVEYTDDVLSAVKSYEKRVRNIPDSHKKQEDSLEIKDVCYESELGNIPEYRFGTGGAKISSLDFVSPTGINLSSYEPSERVSFRFGVSSSITVDNAILGFSLRNSKGVDVAGDNTMLAGQIIQLKPMSACTVTFDFCLNVPAGTYFVYCGLASFDNERIELDQRWPIRKIVVSGGREVVGMAYCPSDVSVQDLSNF